MNSIECLIYAKVQKNPVNILYRIFIYYFQRANLLTSQLNKLISKCVNNRFEVGNFQRSTTNQATIYIRI